MGNILKIGETTVRKDKLDGYKEYGGGINIFVNGLMVVEMITAKSVRAQYIAQLDKALEENSAPWEVDQ